jgi:hypothetical protein
VASIQTKIDGGGFEIGASFHIADVFGGAVKHAHFGPASPTFDKDESEWACKLQQIKRMLH